MIDIKKTFGQTYIVQDVPVLPPHPLVAFIPCDFGRIVVRGDRLAAVVRRGTLADRRLSLLPAAILRETNGDTRVFVFALADFAIVAVIVQPRLLPPPQARDGRQLVEAWR